MIMVFYKSMRLIFLFLFIQVFFGNTILCQFKKISYQEAKEIINQLDPAKNLDSILTLGTQVFYSGDIKGSKAIMLDALPIAEKTHDKQFLPTLYFQLSKISDQEKNAKEAIKYARMALARIHSEKDPTYDKVVFFLGRYYQRQDKLDSMAYFYNLFEEYNNKYSPYNNWKIYESKNEIYVTKGDYEKAYSNALKAYDITKSKNLLIDHGVILYRLMQIALKMNKGELYSNYLKEYIALSKKHNKKPSIHGMPLIFEGTLDQQLLTCKQIIDYCDSVEYPQLMANIFHKTAMLYQEKKDFKSALYYLNKIDTISLSSSAKMDYLKEKYNIQKSLRNMDDAIESLEKHQLLKDSLTNLEKLEQLQDIDAKYETKKKDEKIELMQQLDAAKTSALHQEKRENNLLIFILILIGILFFVTIFFYQKNHQKNILLTENNKVIEKSLMEKEILLKEIHHRVKNNLQVISSILTLQGNFSKDPLVNSALNDGKNRVASMALIHKNLYKEAHLTSINTQKYFDDLIEQIKDTYLVNDSKIKIQKEIDNLLIDVDTMIPLGLIANECITNSLKHAFHDYSNGLIKVTLKKAEHSTVNLSVEDNGSGVDATAFFQSKSFGNRIISTFAEKLNAKLNIEKVNPGTRITLSFRAKIFH